MLCYLFDILATLDALVRCLYAESGNFTFHTIYIISGLDLLNNVKIDSPMKYSCVIYTADVPNTCIPNPLYLIITRGQ